MYIFTVFIYKKMYSTCEKPEDIRRTHFLPALRIVGHTHDTLPGDT